jgi:hypothetical protein
MLAGAHYQETSLRVHHAAAKSNHPVAKVAATAAGAVGAVVGTLAGLGLATLTFNGSVVFPTIAETARKFNDKTYDAFTGK